MAGAAVAREEAAARMRDLQVKLDELASEEQARIEAVTQIRIELATQTQQCDAWQQQREPVAGRLQELRELIAMRTRESREHEQRVAQAKEEIASAEQEQTLKNESLARVAGELNLALSTRSGAQAHIDEQESLLRTLRHDQHDIQSARSENEV